MLTVEEITRALWEIDPADDPEKAHSRADELLLAAVHPEVAAAYRSLQERSSWWAVA